MLLAAALLAGSPRSDRQTSSVTPSAAPPQATAATSTLEIELEPGLCRRQPLVTLATARGTQKVSVAPPACEAVIRGLAPDSYLVRWNAPDGSWGDAVEQVIGGDTHRVRLSDRPYGVGRITIGGQRAAQPPAPSRPP